MAEEPKTPKVFISYSWTSDEHLEWVIALATRLVGDGVEVILDQWDLVEGQDKFVFMEKMATDPSVSKVLAICDKRYAEKADGREGGVGTESQIISKKVYEQVSQEKFIPLVRERTDDGNACLPVFFQGRIYIDFSVDDEQEKSYERLLRNLFGKPERIKPALGKPPAHILVADAPVVAPAPKLERLKDAVLKGKAYTQALVQDFLDSFIECMEQFRIGTINDNDAFDAEFDRSIASFTPFRDCFVNFVIFVADYMDEPQTRDRIARFLELLAPFQERPENCVSWSKLQFDNFKFINYELCLYLISGLIKKRAYKFAAFFIEQRYVTHSSLGGADFEEHGLGVFNEFVTALDDVRNRRRNLKRISVTADLIVKRATLPSITVGNLLQADLFLCIRQFFPGLDKGIHWYPRCAGYLARGQMLELFARAVTPSGIQALQIILKVRDLEDLAIHLGRMFKNTSFTQIFQSSSFWQIGIDVQRLVNFDQILQRADTDKQ